MSNDSWTAPWLANKIREAHKDIQANSMGGNLLHINHEGISYKVATLAVQQVTVADLERVTRGNNVDFALNVSSRTFTQDAYQYSLQNGFGLGKLGDLIRAIGEKNLKQYIEPEAKFILNGLTQHSKVTNVTRIDLARFLVQRKNLKDVIVCAVNEYDFCAQVVRQAKTDYSEFDILLCSNPNGTITSEAHNAAKSMQVSVYMWGELLGALNKP